MKGYLWSLGLTVMLSLPTSSASAHSTQLSHNDDIGFQVDNSGYIIDGQEMSKTYFEGDFEKLAYHRYQARKASGRSVFVFSPRQLRWFAYDGSGNLVGSGRASGGRGYCPDVRRSCRTPVGTYRINSMGDGSCVSTKFPIGRGGAKMPFCMFFRGGFAIHGSYDVPNYNASHGCIRVEPSAARWLRYNVLSIGSTVIVKSY